jgi:hypothetical protein
MTITTTAPATTGTPHTLSTAQRYLQPSIYSCHNT